MQEHLERLNELLAPYSSTPTNAAEKLLAHAGLVLKWGRSMNLTGATKVKELIEEHTADALPLAFGLKSGASLLEVGSGAGFPGVVISIARPDVSVTMLETNHKKTVFLRNTLREVGRKGTVLHGDIFTPPPEMPRTFDAVVARAVFAPEEWVKIGAPFVAEGGSLYALLAGYPTPLAPEGFMVTATIDYRLRSGAKRSVVAYSRG